MTERKPARIAAILLTLAATSAGAEDCATEPPASRHVVRKHARPVAHRKPVRIGKHRAGHATSARPALCRLPPVSPLSAQPGGGIEPSEIVPTGGGGYRITSSVGNGAPMAYAPIPSEQLPFTHPGPPLIFVGHLPVLPSTPTLAVPEPSAAAMLTVGGLVAAWMRRRRRKAIDSLCAKEAK